MSFPTLSVIIANYNYGCFIEDAIDSILSQDFPQEEIEIVVVDYGSTDESREKINKYGTKIHKIFLRPTSFINAINTGLSVCKGKYIGFLGADDKWKSEKSKLQIEFLEKNPDIGLVYADLIIINENSEEIYPSFWKLKNIVPYRGYVLDKLLIKNFVSEGTMVIRRKDKDLFYPIPETKGFEKCEDWWIAFNISRRYPIDFIPSTLTLYRLHTRNQVLKENFGITNKIDLISTLNQEIERRTFMLDLILKDNEAKISKNALSNAVAYNEKRIFQKRLLEEGLIKSLWSILKGRIKIRKRDFLMTTLKTILQFSIPSFYHFLTKCYFIIERYLRKFVRKKYK